MKEVFYDSVPAQLPKLNLGTFLPRSKVNGPGCRAVIWVQGCDQRCSGCYNPELLEVRDHRWFGVDVVAERILRIDGIEGVTYSGGEPTLQAGALAALSQLLRSHGLSVVCYSGHSYEQLCRSGTTDVQLLLENVDLLIDGPFDRSRVPGGIWRGSANQRLIALSDRYARLCASGGADVEQGIGGSALTPVEIHVGNGRTTWTGVFPPKLAREVAHTLKRDAKAAGISEKEGSP